MKFDTYRTELVEFIPEQLEAGVLYVSHVYGTGAHLCPCGCGNEIATPFTPLDWKLIFDGTFSVSPSVGNGGLACRSHYFFSHGKVVWASSMGAEEVRRTKSYEQAARDQHYGEQDTPNAPAHETWWRRLLRFIGLG